MKLRTRIAPIALTAALSLGLAACGGDDPEPAATEQMTEDMDDMTEGDEMDDDMTEDDMTEDEG